MGAPTREAAAGQAEAERVRFAEARKQHEIQLPPPLPAPDLKPGPPKRLSESRKRFSLEVTWDWVVVPPEADPVMAKLGGSAYKSILTIEQRDDVKLAGARSVRLVILQEVGPVTTRLLKYIVALPDQQALARSLQLAR